MELNDYQSQVKIFNNDPAGLGPYMSILGLNKCMGEYCSIMSNMINGDNEKFTADEANKIKVVLGDMLYWISHTADALEVPLDDIADINIRKHHIAQEYRLKKSSMRQVKK